MKYGFVVEVKLKDTSFKKQHYKVLIVNGKYEIGKSIFSQSKKHYNKNNKYNLFIVSWYFP